MEKKKKTLTLAAGLSSKYLNILELILYKSDTKSEIRSCHFNAVTACEVDVVVRFLLSPVVDATATITRMPH